MAETLTATAGFFSPGATLFQAGVRMSETPTSFPATVSFTINDDEAAVEAVERYSLTLIHSDPAISINPATTEIVILDDDSKQQNMHYSQTVVIVQ